jgi:demethylmenaquinone methyltransferase/2-methoxy-6-polyprenyl-1,4-benzoquinol methylase
MVDPERVRVRLAVSLASLDIGDDEHILDIGCGTGSSTMLLLRLLGPGGRVSAVDISPVMLAVAQGKVSDPRVTWFHADAVHLPHASGSTDRVLCYSVWPHFTDPLAVLRELWRVVKPGGKLHILHTEPRERINSIHRGVGGALAEDVLPPASVLADHCTSSGWNLLTMRDDDGEYVVTAKKPEDESRR